MVNSMTGFASVLGEADGYRWVWEVRSVNGRGLDVRTRLPEGVPGLEEAVRGLVRKSCSRGSVTLGCRLQKDGEGDGLLPDPATLDAVLAAVRTVEARAEALGVELQKSRATDLLSMRISDGSRQAEQQDLKDFLLADARKAIAAMMDMRSGEGAALAEVIADQLNRIAACVDQATQTAGDRSARMRTAIEKQLERLTAETSGVDPERLAQELALIAVKADVSEELDRLRAHIDAARNLLAQKGPIGRKLDFLVQEFMREANTLCSKSQDQALTAVGLDLKTVIDQMREQIQNVE